MSIDSEEKQNYTKSLSIKWSLIFLLGAFAAIDVTLFFKTQADASIYYIIDSIVFLILSLTLGIFNPRYKTVSQVTGTMVFIGFVVVIAFKILRMLS